jgi:hypothetical protein
MAGISPPCTSCAQRNQQYWRRDQTHCAWPSTSRRFAQVRVHVLTSQTFDVICSSQIEDHPTHDDLRFQPVALI